MITRVCFVLCECIQVSSEAQNRVTTKWAYRRSRETILFCQNEIRDVIALKKTFFSILQTLLSRFSYLVHVDKARQLFVNLDESKIFDFEAMIYHVKNWNEKNYSKRFQIQPILFSSRLLISAETRYWFIELELARIVWVLKKIRHMMESTNSSLSTVIFIDHEAALRIEKQTSLTINCIDKLNLRLIRVSNYIQRFNLDIRHKSRKQHIVSDALSRLVSVNTNSAKNFMNEKKLDALITTTLVKMNEAFCKKIIESYSTNLN